MCTHGHPREDRPRHKAHPTQYTAHSSKRVLSSQVKATTTNHCKKHSHQSNLQVTGTSKQFNITLAKARTQTLKQFNITLAKTEVQVASELPKQARRYRRQDPKYFGVRSSQITESRKLWRGSCRMSEKTTEDNLPQTSVELRRQDTGLKTIETRRKNFTALEDRVSTRRRGVQIN